MNQIGSRFRPALGGLASWLVLAVLALLYATGSSSRDQLVTVMLINAVIVVGIQIYTGNTGIVSFGHVSLAGIAAYLSALLATPSAVKMSIIPHAPFGLAHVEMPPVLGILLAVVITTAIAAVLGLAINRVSGLTASIVTLAMLFVVNAVLTNWKDLTGGAEAFYGIPVVTTRWWVLAALLAAVLAARYFWASRVGLRARAGRDDELAAASMGVRVVRARYFSWVVSAVFAALGGALLGHLLGAIQPGTFYLSLNFLTLAMLVLGGIVLVFFISSGDILDLGRRPIGGAILGAELQNGEITFVPMGPPDRPTATTTFRDGRYQFDRDNGPAAGLHRVSVKFGQQTPASQELSVPAVVPEEKPWELDISLR